MTAVQMPTPPDGHYWEVCDSPSRRYMLVALMRKQSLWRFRPTSQVQCKCAGWSNDPALNANNAAQAAREILENPGERRVDSNAADSRLVNLSGYVDSQGVAR